MLSSIVFCAGSVTMVAMVLDGWLYVRGIEYFAIPTGAALGIIVGIKLIK